MSTPVYVKIGRSVFHFFWLDMMTNEFLCLSGSDSVSDEEFSDTVCNRQQAKLSTQATLGKIDELIGNSDAMTNESVRNLLFKLKKRVKT
ncbi:hypothetical protein AVEN_218248-1 [Araneus ventricosus]|uniref:Uncharacterized protein n=1 Tax=Araneus ventricosus TaxID=182803 RepID=A0A4Y2SJ67_ARAVE|nr:hypothetical protein AVEN_218248-1 [Araneus ventricosus]